MSYCFECLKELRHRLFKYKLLFSLLVIFGFFSKLRTVEDRLLNTLSQHDIISRLHMSITRVLTRGESESFFYLRHVRQA